AEAVEQLSPRVEVPQRAQPRERGRGRMLRHELLQPLEIGRRHEMVEDVDDHTRPPEGAAMLGGFMSAFQAEAITCAVPDQRCTRLNRHRRRIWRKAARCTASGTLLPAKTIRD